MRMVSTCPFAPPLPPVNALPVVLPPELTTGDGPAAFLGTGKTVPPGVTIKSGALFVVAGPLLGISPVGGTAPGASDTASRPLIAGVRLGDGTRVRYEPCGTNIPPPSRIFAESPDLLPVISRFIFPSGSIQDSGSFPTYAYLLKEVVSSAAKRTESGLRNLPTFGSYQRAPA